MNPSQPSKLDQQLQDLAATDWQAFVRLLGPDVINKAKVCLLRHNNKSYGEISNRLGVTKMQVRTACKRCDD